MKTHLLSIFFAVILFTNYLHAQYDPSKVDPKAQAVYNNAISRAQDGSLVMSIPLFKQAIDMDPGYVDAYISLAGVYGQMKDHASSVEYYEKAFAKDTAYTKLFKLPYSINLAGKGEFEKALAAVNEYLAHPRLGENSRKAGEYRKRAYEFAIEWDKKNSGRDYVFSPVNLGDQVNSQESEYFPSLTIDGKELVFTRRIKNYNEDFYSAKFDQKGWSRATALPGSINTEQNEGAQMISPDGQWLVFTGCNRSDGWGSCDIYISYLTPNGWSEALNLGGSVNSDQWDSQPCLSPDKRELYFASRRFGGFGGSDLYVSHLQPNGQWSAPENLGPDINTKGDEACPFIHADNQTLYFTSSGLQGYGEDDIFYVRKGPKGGWSLPQNLGFPVNTIHKEGTLFISSDAKTAYYASDRSDSRGGLDIYSFELRESTRPHKTLWVKGKVFDKKTTKGLPSSVELIDLANNRLMSKVLTDEEGNYMITLPVGKDYAFNVNRKGYLFYSDNYFLSQRSPDSTYEKNIPLQPIELNASVVLKNIFFDVNKYNLKNESGSELGKVVQLLQENPTLKIEIGGHTDSVGKTADNKILSQNRAKAVVNYLVMKGISPSRLIPKGFGSTQPVAPNKTEEGRALNRRTELKVVGR